MIKSIKNAEMQENIVKLQDLILKKAVDIIQTILSHSNLLQKIKKCANQSQRT